MNNIQEQEKRMKNWLRGTLISLGILAGAVLSGGQVYAANTIGYTGPLDPVTGEPIGEGEDGSSTTNIQILNEYSWYDFDSSRFVYAIGNGEIHSTVAEGMVTTDEVVLSYINDPQIVLYKDGEQITPLPETVSEPGSYVITNAENGEYSDSLDFRIVKRVTGELYQYVIPEGFYLTTVLFNGVDVTTGYGSVDMTEEGYYDVTYVCAVTQMSYSLKVSVDHTPPQVVFKGLNSKNQAKGPVTLEGLDENDTVYVTYNDESSHLDMKNRLTESGRYSVVVVDEAGNVVSKNFRILVYLNVKAWMFLGIIVLGLAGIAAALLLSRKRLRVR